MSLRAQLGLVGAALFAPLLLSPLLLTPQLGLAFAGAVVLVLLAWRSIAYPVALASLPVVAIGLLGSNPFPDNGVALFVFGWISLGVAFTLTREEDAFPRRALLSAPVVLSVLFTAWLIVRLGPSSAPAYGAFKTQLFIAQNATLLVAGVLVARRRTRFDLFVLLLLGMSALSALLLARGLTAGTVQESVGGRFSTSAADSPIELGRDAARGLLLAAYVLLVGHASRHRLLALLSIPLIAVAFVAAGSRGPVLGLLAGLVVLVALTATDWRTRRRTLLLIAGAVASAILITQLVPGQNVERTLGVFSGTEEGLSSNGRFELWSLAWDAFRDRPLSGLGTGGFAAIAPFDNYPHNIFLEVASELGVVGLALFTAILVFGALGLVRILRTGAGSDRQHAALVCSLLTAALVNALFSSDLPTNKAVWLAVGLAVGLASSEGTGRAARLPRLRRRAAGGPEPASEPESEDARRRGEILAPRPGTDVDGVVEVLARPAASVWGIAAVQLQELGPEGWRVLATVEERDFAVYELRGGTREEIGVLRSRPLADLLVGALGDGRDVRVAVARRRPWMRADEVAFTWDAGTGGVGRRRLRLLTVDGAGREAVSDEVEVHVPIEVNVACPVRGVALVDARVSGAAEGELLLEIGRGGKWGAVARTRLPGTALQLDTTRVEDGTYDLRLRLEAPGRPAVLSEPVSALIDNTPPSVRLVAPAPGQVIAGGATLRAEASDELTGVASFLFQYSLGGRAWRPVLSPETGTERHWSLAPVRPGPCFVRVTAFDGAGNQAVSPSVKVVVAAVAEPARAPEPQRVVVEAPTEPPAPASPSPDPTAAGITIDELERLVIERPDPHPSAQKKRLALVVHLREFAEVDGTIPPAFRSRVDELLEGRG